jgi:hypothetical protein
VAVARHTQKRPFETSKQELEEDHSDDAATSQTHHKVHRS